MMTDLRPAALLLINEYNRREFVVAARSAGLPSFAVQHGIIYPGHVGYVLGESRASCFPPDLRLRRRTRPTCCSTTAATPKKRSR